MSLSLKTLASLPSSVRLNCSICESSTAGGIAVNKEDRIPASLISHCHGRRPPNAREVGD